MRLRASAIEFGLLSGEEWEQARSIRKAKHHEAMAQIKRFRHVQERIATACEAGKLEAFTRQVEGGQMSAMPCCWWNTENFGYRFDEGQINRERPFACVQSFTMT